MGPTKKHDVIRWLGVFKRLWALRGTGSTNSLEAARREVAEAYLRGKGLEIGALHRPLYVPCGVQVTYVDRAPLERLREHYPEFRDMEFAPVTVVTDGQTLDGIPDESQDFVIANHVIEHMEDPICALKNWLRVLRPGGLIYLVLPDKQFTFDRVREVTSIEHLMRDHVEGARVSRREHYDEWARKVMGVKAARVNCTAERLEKDLVSIHFHVWDTPRFTHFLLHLRSNLHLPFKIELRRRNGHETIFVLVKSPVDPRQNRG